MKTFKNIGSMLAGAAMITTVVGMTAGLAPAAAAPKQDGATLAFTANPNSPGNYYLVVNGAFPMEQPDAQGYINNINTGQCGEKGYSGILYDIFGDDGKQQQQIEARWIPGARVDSEGRLSAGSRGLEYSRVLPLPHYYLDVDRGSDDDEIYVRVRFVDADCGTRNQTTQVVSHRF